MSAFPFTAVPSAFRQDLAATAQHLATVLPAEAAQVIDAGIASVEAANLGQYALQAGQVAPFFSLPGADRQAVALADVLLQGPIVLFFHRGNWCPYCNVQLRAYQQALPALALRGATLVAVSPQTPDFTGLTASEKALTFLVLSDVGNLVARQYGLAYAVGPEVANTLRSWASTWRPSTAPPTTSYPSRPPSSSAPMAAWPTPG